MEVDHWCIIYAKPRARLIVHCTPMRIIESCPNLPDTCTVVDSPHGLIHVFTSRLHARLDNRFSVWPRR